MPGLLHSPHSLSLECDLERSLRCAQVIAKSQNAERILSFAQTVEPRDPLAVYRTLARAAGPMFFWQNRSRGEALAAGGAARSLAAGPGHRFARARAFVRRCTDRLLRAGEQPAAGPYFACSFTFFARGRGPRAFPPATVLLPAIQLVCRPQGCTLVANASIGPHSDLDRIGALLAAQWQAVCQAQHSFPDPPLAERRLQAIPQSPAAYKGAVSRALAAIRSGKLRKIVLAHALEVSSPVALEPVAALERLRQRHPDCYVFATRNSQGESFVGASPERLLSLHNGWLTADALAGSAPRGRDGGEDAERAAQLRASAKEQREHRAVSDALIQQLRALGLQPLRSPLQLRQLSQIQHLWTPVQARVGPELDPLDIAARLHPTPAVAGTPTQAACERLHRFESGDRGLYAAPLGWVDGRGNGELVVGIRSAAIAGHRARLHAGAGIVAGSDPERELAEVELKQRSLLSALA